MANLNRLSAAMWKLFQQAPFYAHLLYSLKRVETDQIPTMGVDGVHLFYNLKFVESLTIDEVVFVLAHEAHHCFCADMYEVGTRDPELWNIAADIRINEELLGASVGVMPSIGVRDQAVYVEAGGRAHAIYDIIRKDPKYKNRKSAMDVLMPGVGAQDPAQAQAAKNKLKRAVAAAAQAARDAGNLPGNIAREIDQLLNPPPRWQDVLRRFMTEKSEDDYGWAKFRSPLDRLVDPIYLPGRVGVGMGRVAVAIDTSGSIGAKELREFGAEVRSICEDTRPKGVEVIYFDSRVVRHDTFDDATEVMLEACGGGGTEYQPVWDAIAALPDVACAVMLTDMFPNSGFGTPPDVPVLFASNSHVQDAPFGQVVDIRENA